MPCRKAHVSVGAFAPRGGDVSRRRDLLVALTLGGCRRGTHRKDESYQQAAPSTSSLYSTQWTMSMAIRGGRSARLAPRSTRVPSTPVLRGGELGPSSPAARSWPGKHAEGEKMAPAAPPERPRSAGRIDRKKTSARAANTSGPAKGPVRRRRFDRGAEQAERGWPSGQRALTEQERAYRTVVQDVADRACKGKLPGEVDN